PSPPRPPPCWSWPTGWPRWASATPPWSPPASTLASWAGMCPGNDQSAGKRRSGRTTEGSVWLRTALVQAAWAASHTKETCLATAYRKWAKRLGRKKALVALGHKMLTMVYAMLKGGSDYVERLAPKAA